MICSMNSDRSTLADTDLPPLDPNGAPAEDQAALGYGRDDAGDATWRKRRAALLEQMAERGVDLAGELPALAKAQSRLAEAVTECLHKATPEGRAALGELAVTLHQGNVDFALMYERISRSVRRCIAMREQAPSLWASAAAARGAAGATTPRPRASGGRAAEAPRDPEVEAEKDMAAGRTGEGEAEDLFSDLYDRPEDPTGMADLGLDRPMAELVAEICADFGVDGKIWAERLGIEDDAAGDAASATGKNRSGAARRRSRREIRPRKGTSSGTPPAPPTAPLAADDPVRRAPDRSDAADPGSPGSLTGAGLGGRNRRERRAMRKLLGRKPPQPANRRPLEGGRGPP
jgi:hypothetical protein